MSEQLLRERLADLVEPQPVMRVGSAEDVRRGHRRLLVRRGVAIAGTAVLVAGVLAGGALLSDQLSGAGGRDATDGPASGTATATEPGVVERCTRVDNGALDSKTFGPGSRVLTSDRSGSGDVSAVLVSADGRTWGDCWLSGDASTEFNGSASAYPMKAGRPGAGQMETAGMSFGRGRFWWVDRFPADVARVTVDVGGATPLSARAVHGFVAFDRDVPGLDMSASPSFDVTLYAADGHVLADKSMAPGDASLPREYRTLVPPRPLPDGGAGR